MAGKDGDPSELDVLALLHEVHGTQTGARGAAVEQALRTLEATHRRASLAMQTFERDGNPAARRAATAPGPTAAPADERRPTTPTPGSVPRRVVLEATEATAVWRPDDAPPAAGEPLPRPSSPEATAVGPAPGPQAGNAGHGAAAFVDPGTRAPSPAAPEVYAGRGADWSLRERTKTQRIARPKTDEQK